MPAGDPRLIQPIDVWFETWDPTNQIQDDDAREPIHGARHSVSKFSIPAQVHWYDMERAEFNTGAGVRESSRGYIIVRMADLTANNKTLKRGDRITKLGNYNVNLYLVEFEPCGHWSSVGGATLLMARFADRAPSKLPSGS